MRHVLLACATTLAVTAASLGADWPLPGGPMLEIGSGGATAQFPAPDWIGEASHDEIRPDANNVVGQWRVLGGFDLVNERLVAMLADAEHWNLGLIGHLNDVFFKHCDMPLEKDLDPAAGSPTFQLTYALCGYDYGSGRGAMLFGLTRDAGPDLVFDLWYEVPVARFEIADETTWPMTADGLEATVRALDAQVSVTARH